VRECESARVRKWGSGERGAPVGRGRERVNSPQQQRKAPQTARGFCVRTPRCVIPKERRTAFSVSRTPARDRGIYPLLLVAVRGAEVSRLQSTQVDFAPFQRRIHSLLDAGGTTAGGNTSSPRPQSAQADFVWLLQRIHSLGQAVRTRAVRRASISRLQSTQVDFAPFQRRIHSLLDAGGTTAGGNTSSPRPQSAQADFVWLLQRIHSPVRRDLRP
jgi:hypothetical protein